MALSEVDRNLLQKCLGQKPRAWEDFVDRYMGLFVHVVNHSAESRSMRDDRWRRQWVRRGLLEPISLPAGSRTELSQVVTLPGGQHVVSSWQPKM